MRIAHIGDVHWRGLTRHKEYRRVFTRMFEKLRALKLDRIVVCGDIVHSKTQGISPELIDQLVWWFESLAEICYVDVILGNHDGNLMNPHRQDAISPIISAINSDRITLYKDSGVYNFAPGYNWCVLSIFDEKGWDKVKPVPGDVNIALFHGSVAGSTTDTGWALEADLNVEDFKGYDFVFLGDIHKQQYLAYRDVGKEKKPWIAYSGSTIMQSYGEVPGKGFLLWDIKSSDDYDVSFHKVPHDREFWTIDWQGSLKETLKKASEVPNGSRIRIRADSLIPHVEIKQLANELKQLQGASEVVFKDEYAVDANTIGVDTVQFQKDDLRDVDVLMKLFHEYFDESSFNESEWEEIKQLTQKYITRAASNDITARHSRWSLRDLKFDNTFGYGKDNYVNFRNMNGITGIFGPNRAGKSSIIGTLLYSLFNATDRGNVKNLHVINSRKSHCKTQLTLAVNGKDYRIERQTAQGEDGKGRKYAVTSLNFSKLDEDGKIEKDLNGEQRKDTEKVIRKMIGTHEDCLLTGVAAQGDMNRFIDEGSTNRDQIISRFLDLLVFDYMHDYAKEDSSIIKSKVNSAPDRDWDTIIEKHRGTLRNLDDEVSLFEIDIRSERNKLDNMKLELAKAVDDDIITPADVIRATDDVRRNKEKLEACNDDVRTQSEQLEIEQEWLDDAQDQLDQIPVDELHECRQILQSLKDTLVDFRHQHERESHILENQEKSVLKLLDVPCGDQFPQCKYIRDSHNDKLLIDAQRIKANDLLERVSESERALAEFEKEKIEERLRRHSELLKSESESKVRLIHVKQSLESAERAALKAQADLDSSRLVLEDYIEREVDTQDDESEALKVLISKSERILDELDAKRLQVATTRGSVAHEISRLESERDTYKELRVKWRIYEMFIQATSKKGIPAQIIKSQLPVINSEIAKILHGVVDYTLIVEKDEHDDKTHVYIDYGDSRRMIELGSGMEKMISSLAIRVALQNASSLPKPDFLILDEGFGSLDETNIEACNRMLVSLKRWFKNIIVITHIDAVKDITDNIIEITRNGKDSYVYSE